MRDRTWLLPAVALIFIALAPGCHGDAFTPECVTGDQRCSEDAFELEVCRDGRWVVGRACMADEGRLCQGDVDDAACVDPWRYGSPRPDPCRNDPNGTAMTLAEKAAKYDRLMEVLHVHPEHKRIAHVTVADGYTEADATYEDVIRWHTGENDGLWTGLYIASQAFRYAATRDPRALGMLRLMMEGMEIGSAITGVSGLFTREYKTPGIEGMECPSNPESYSPSADKKDNRWLKVDTDGTVVAYDCITDEWVRMGHRVPKRFAGYCWLDNISQDEYAGHMLALASVYRFVDDPEVRGKAGRLLEEVAEHIMVNDVAFVDWDGRRTEHGDLWYNPAYPLAWVKPGLVASGRDDLLDFYDNCLLQRGEPRYDCRRRPYLFTFPYDEYMPKAALVGFYLGQDGCKSNWNNFAMIHCSMFTLLLYEQDPELRTLAAQVLEELLFNHLDNPREMSRQHNAGWSMIYASMKNVGPGSTGQDIAAIEDAVCALRQFPESKASPEIHIGEDEFPTDFTCESRFEGRFLTFDPVPVYQRCPGTYTWWSNPYRHQNCSENPRYIKHGADYLLPYWMGRYFGYIDAGW